MSVNMSFWTPARSRLVIASTISTREEVRPRSKNFSIALKVSTRFSIRMPMGSAMSAAEPGVGPERRQRRAAGLQVLGGAHDRAPHVRGGAGVPAEAFLRLVEVAAD